MYAIKMNSDKSLSATIKATIYQGEKNSDTLVFLVPMLYGDINFASCGMYLQFILPSGTAQREKLEMDPEPYKDYYMYRLTVESRFTDVPGEIKLWLTAEDRYKNVVLLTGNIFVSVLEVQKIEVTPDVSDDERLNALSAKVTMLEKNKADNIMYNRGEKYLQLTSNGVAIGDQIALDGSSGGSEDGGVIDFDNESSGDSSSTTKDDVIYF